VRECFGFDGLKVEGSAAVVQSVAACCQYCTILRTLLRMVCDGSPDGRRWVTGWFGIGPNGSRLYSDGSAATRGDCGSSRPLSDVLLINDNYLWTNSS
jgi:hypothetical protein